MPKVFLNYRRGDALGSAGRLLVELRARYGEHEIVVEVDSIEPGVHFEEVVESAVRSADVFLALIGPEWFQPGPDGRRRIDDPADFVRLEIEVALTSDIPVIPVLVGGARMPSAEELPEQLRPLARRHALELRDRAWKSDVAKLLTQLEVTGGVEIGGSMAIGSQEIGGSMGSDLEVIVGESRLPAAGRPSPAKQPSTAEVLSSMLRDAALAGVVSARRRIPEAESELVYASEPPVVPPPAPASRYEPEPSPPPSTNRWRRYDGRGVGARREYRIGLWSWRVVVPLALLGAGVVVSAKWLLGWFVPEVESAEAFGDTVVCTVFAPPSAAPGNSILVQAFAHLPEQTGDARAIATELDTDALRRTFHSLESPVRLGGRLHFELRMPGLEIDDPVASLVWQRRVEAVQFGVRIPPETPAGTVIGTLEISVDSAPVGHVKFKLDVGHRTEPAPSEQHVQRARPYTVVVRRSGPAPSEPQGERARRYTAAFISYASGDREKVLARVQMLSAVGIRYFQDLLSLEPGDRWEKKLELGIDECDLFLLFWSSESKRSEWVRKEVRYALDRRGPDELSPPEIRPVMLEGPPIVKPWEELAHLHFNDRLLYFMRPPDAGSGPSP